MRQRPVLRSSSSGACRLLARHAKHIEYIGNILYEHCAKIAYIRPRNIIVGLVRTSEYKPEAVHHFTLRIVSHISQHSVDTTFIVRVLKRLLAYGNKLTFVVCRTAGFGVPFHASFPKDILLAMAHPVYVILQYFIVGERCTGDILFIGFNLFKMVVCTPFCVLCHIKEFL